MTFGCLVSVVVYRPTNRVHGTAVVPNVPRLDSCPAQEHQVHMWPRCPCCCCVCADVDGQVVVTEVTEGSAAAQADVSRGERGGLSGICGEQ